MLLGSSEAVVLNTRGIELIHERTETKEETSAATG
jgi:hypothetical protein